MSPHFLLTLFLLLPPFSAYAIENFRPESTPSLPTLLHSTPDTFSHSLQEAVQVTKNSLPDPSDKRKETLYSTKYLPELLILLDHNSENTLEKTLPMAFVSLQIDRAKKIIGNEKFPFFKSIVQDLDLPPSQPFVPLEIYNYTCLRLMALALLKVEEISPILIYKEKFLTHFENLKSLIWMDMTGKSFFEDVSLYLSNQLKTVIPLTDTKSYFYSLLICADASLMQQNKNSPLNFVSAFNLNRSVHILDKFPFIGSQTLVLSMLTNISLIAAPLTDQIGAHGSLEYEGAFGVMHHDREHTRIWETVILKNLRLLLLDKTYLCFFLDIYRLAINSPCEGQKKTIIDFLFIMMHEDSDIATVAFQSPCFQPGISDLLHQLTLCNLPKKQLFNDLCLIISSNPGYENASDDYDNAIERFRRETITLIAEGFQQPISKYSQKM